MRLADGTAYRIRSIRPEDKELLSAGLASVSAETRYKRFLAPKPRLSSGELRYLTEVDGENHVALVAVHRDDPSRLAAVARFVRDREEPASAEAAIVVADEAQGQGLGRRMGLALADAARERGIERFTATLLSDNVAAQRVFAAISRRLSTTSAGGVRELVAELDLAA